MCVRHWHRVGGFSVSQRFMDEEMIEFIKKSIDYVLMHDNSPDVEFIRDVIPFKSFEDIAFGYA